MKRSIRTVVVAERHEATRVGIRGSLEHAGFTVVAECADAASAVAAVTRTRPSVCLIDADLPGGGIRVVRAISEGRSPPRIVVLSTTARDADLFAALGVPADGFIAKDIDPARLPEELAAVAARRSAMRSRTSSPQSLSARESDVLDLLVEGLTTKEIGVRLDLAASTVRRYVASALKKLGLPDRAAAIERMRRLQRGERQ